MKIGLLHFRVGETDGVSLEMEKWKTVLERLGHEVLYIAGELNGLRGIEIPSISIRNEDNILIHNNAFESPTMSEESFAEFFQEYVNKIYSELEMNLPKLDLLIVHNVLSLGFNLAAAVAITRFIEEKKIKLLCHNHDFYWERERYANPQYNLVRELLEEYFPPKREGQVFHITINNIARKELLKRKQVDSVVVPNVFDFNQPRWTIDEYNKDLRKCIGVGDNEIMILHATRIVERKAIEIAMDFVEEFANISKLPVKFVLAGFPERESTKYYQRLLEKAERMSFKSSFVYPMVRANRFVDEVGTKYYSLWDMYAVCDAITYTSVLEGWGNQLIEAVFAKKPLVIYEYPVYKTDIEKFDFRFITISNKAKYNTLTGFYEIDRQYLVKAALHLNTILNDKKTLSDNVEYNFEIGKKFLSLESLEKYINDIFELMRLS